MNKEELVSRIKLVLSKANLSDELIETNTQLLLDGLGSKPIKLKTSNHFVQQNKITDELLHNNTWDQIYNKLDFIADENQNDSTFYSIDQSSLFMASPLFQISNKTNISILDTCASPGGKSILACSILDYAKIVSNEKSHKRLQALRENFNRVQLQNSRITNYDIRDLTRNIDEKFDLVIVDGPCSGQALLGKGFDNFSSYSSMKIRISAEIQKKILIASLNFLKDNSYLLYSTCTYSVEENENIIKWLLKKFSYLKPQELPFLSAHRSNAEINFPCYKLFPSDGLGAGGFTCLLKKR